MCAAIRLRLRPGNRRPDVRDEVAQAEALVSNTGETRSGGDDNFAAQSFSREKVRQFAEAAFTADP